MSTQAATSSATAVPRHLDDALEISRQLLVRGAASPTAVIREQRATLSLFDFARASERDDVASVERTLIIPAGSVSDGRSATREVRTIVSTYASAGRRVAALDPAAFVETRVLSASLTRRCAWARGISVMREQQAKRLRRTDRSRRRVGPRLLYL
jgi:hypothetical protein